MASKKQERLKIIKKQMLREKDKNYYSKGDLWLKYILMIVSCSLGIGLFYFFIFSIIKDNIVIENLGMLLEGFLFLLASIYLVSVIKRMFKKLFISLTFSIASIIIMFYISQLFSIFLLFNFNDEYIQFLIIEDLSKLQVLRNMFFGLHRQIFGFNDVSNIFNIVYSSSYMASFLSPILLFFDKL